MMSSVKEVGPRSRTRPLATIAVGAVALIACWAGAVRADAFVYWGNQGAAMSVGRASLDGSAADQSFITGPYAAAGGAGRGRPHSPAKPRPRKDGPGPPARPG